MGSGRQHPYLGPGTRPQLLAGHVDELGLAGTPGPDSGATFFGRPLDQDFFQPPDTGFVLAEGAAFHDGPEAPETLGADFGRYKILRAGTRFRTRAGRENERVGAVVLGFSRHFQGL